MRGGVILRTDANESKWLRTIAMSNDIHGVGVFCSTIQHVMTKDRRVRIRAYVGNKSAAAGDVRDYLARGPQVNVSRKSVEELPAFRSAARVADSVTNASESEIVRSQIRERSS